MATVHTMPPGEGLPPQEFCSIDLSDMSNYQQLDTPVDERGLIVVPELVALVKNLVDPTYEWPRLLSVHHLYNPEGDYPNRPDQPGGSNPRIFRNLPIHKALVPRQFENLLHWATRPSDLPEPEVMAYRVEAWNVAEGLFKAARATVSSQRMAQGRRRNIAEGAIGLRPDFAGVDREGEAYIRDVFEKNFRGLARHLELSAQIPPDHRLIEHDVPPDELARTLGKLVGPRALRLVRAVAA